MAGIAYHQHPTVEDIARIPQYLYLSPLLRPISICIGRLRHIETAQILHKYCANFPKLPVYFPENVSFPSNSAENRSCTLNILHYYGSNMVRFVRTLQHRVTPQGRDFYALSIPPQVAEALGLKAGGTVDIIVKPVKKGRYEVTISKTESDNRNP